MDNAPGEESFQHYFLSIGFPEFLQKSGSKITCERFFVTSSLGMWRYEETLVMKLGSIVWEFFICSYIGKPLSYPESAAFWKSNLFAR